MWTQSTSVSDRRTDGQTDRQTDRQTELLSQIPCNAEHRTVKTNTRFRLVPKSTTLVDHEITLDGNYAPCCITHMFSEPATKTWMKINPYCQRQKCSQGNLVSRKVSFMRIFEGIRWRVGRKMRVGWSKIAIFASFACYIFQTFTSNIYYTGLLCSPLVALQWYRNR